MCEMCIRNVCTKYMYEMYVREVCTGTRRTEDDVRRKKYGRGMENVWKKKYGRRSIEALSEQVQQLSRLHAGLSKAQSSILTQVRTGKIGLAAFLCKRRVPGFPTPACSCGAQWETARHVVVACPRLLRARCSLHAAASTTDYQVMTSRPRPAAALTAWILRHGVLPQFSWAQEQLEAGY